VNVFGLAWDSEREAEDVANQIIDFYFETAGVCLVVQLFKSYLILGEDS